MRYLRVKLLIFSVSVVFQIAAAAGFVFFFLFLNICRSQRFSEWGVYFLKLKHFPLSTDF